MTAAPIREFDPTTSHEHLGTWQAVFRKARYPVS
jgi:hypothetical protein